MKFIFVSLSLILVILLSGCTEDVIHIEETVTEEGFRDVLVIKDITTIPSSPLIPDVDVILSFIVENEDEEKEAINVKVELFDATGFKNEGGEVCNSAVKPCQPNQCSEDNLCKFLPGEQKLISFVLKAPTEDEIATLETDIELRFRVEYAFDGSLLYRTMVIDMEELKARQRAGETVSLEIPKFLGSGPVQIDVELMGAPYIISGYSGTFLFRVKKVSSIGILKNSIIPEGNLRIEFPTDLGEVEAGSKFTCDSKDVCTNSEEIALYKGESPNLYFKVSHIELVSDVPYQSFEIKAEVDYIYELRDSIKVKVKPYI